MNMETDKIIQDNELNCSVEEFESYYNGLTIVEPSVTLTKHSFNEKYNNITIENPTNDGTCYYTLEMESRVYLQAHAPYVGGLVGITDINYTAISNGHKTQVIEEYINSEKLNQTITNFKE